VSKLLQDVLACILQVVAFIGICAAMPRQPTIFARVGAQGVITFVTHMYVLSLLDAPLHVAITTLASTYQGLLPPAPWGLLVLAVGASAALQIALVNGTLGLLQAAHPAYRAVASCMPSLPRRCLGVPHDIMRYVLLAMVIQLLGVAALRGLASSAAEPVGNQVGEGAARYRGALGVEGDTRSSDLAAAVELLRPDWRPATTSGRSTDKAKQRGSHAHESCAVCGVYNNATGSPHLHCCSHGGSWEGKCVKSPAERTPAANHTLVEGWKVCNLHGRRQRNKGRDLLPGDRQKRSPYSSSNSSNSGKSGKTKSRKRHDRHEERQERQQPGAAMRHENA
jgi:hypothetical protein